jgi:hypothetical protein
MKKILSAGFVTVLLLGSCARNDTYTIKPQPVVVTKKVSFSTDLQPIFTANCALSGCHVSGGQNPDLTAANSYASLKTGGFYSLENPASSIIYMRLTGGLTPQMPLGKTPNPSNIEGLVLAWIQQGAKQN